MNGFAIRHRSALVMAALLALLPAAAGCSGDGESEGGPGDRDEAGTGGRGGAGAAGDDRAGSSGASGGGGGLSGGGSTGEAGAESAGDSGGGETGGDGGSTDPGGDAGDDDPASACNARAEEHEHDSLPAMHVAEPLPASSYNSSPPSSGPHCPEWGRYTVFTDPPLPACNFLHNLEHGAIVLLYNCPDGCADLVEQLAHVIADAPPDPDCGSAKRLLQTPYAEMDATIGAAAWGYTFTADCLDDAARAALLDFITAHQGSTGDAPEPSVCAQGTIGP